MRKVGTIGEWKYQHHRMVRFEDGRLFSFVASLDDTGKRWGWVVTLPGRSSDSRTTGESATALEGARAADAVAAELVTTPADPEAVQRWSAEHMAWRAEAEQIETESTRTWMDR